MFERENPEAKKAYYEERLWKKAEELSALRQQLSAELIELYDQITKREVGAIGLHAEELIREKQTRYSKVDEEIEDIKQLEKEIEQLLEQLSEGKIDEELLNELFGDDPQKPRLSKRKQKILEEKKKMEAKAKLRHGDDEFANLLDSTMDTENDRKVKNYGPGSNAITTGHHAKRIKGVIKSERGDYKDVEGEFYRATQDTHGGKAKHGKTGTWYVNKSGKNVRKR